jgi:hypothetical protein
MRLPSDAETNKKKVAQESNMDDLCNIVHVTRSSGTYSPKGTETRTMVSGVACGIDFTNGVVRQGNQVLVVDYDAVLRIPATYSILPSDEIQLIEKGNYQVSGTFKPNSQPTVSSSVQKVELKRIF